MNGDALTGQTAAAYLNALSRSGDAGGTIHAARLAADARAAQRGAVGALRRLRGAVWTRVAPQIRRVAAVGGRPRPARRRPAAKAKRPDRPRPSEGR